MLKKYLNNKGFGLVELLISVVIVISLSAVSFNYYKMSLEKSKVIDAMSMLRKIADAHMLYYRENRIYTDDITKLLVKFDGEEVAENGYNWIKTELFLYRTDVPPSASDSSDSSFKIAFASRPDKYNIYAIYDPENESLKFDADADFCNSTSFIDGKIIEKIHQNGKL